MNKRLLIIALLLTLMLLSAAAASAHGAGLGHVNWALGHGDIVDALREVPPET